MRELKLELVKILKAAKKTPSKQSLIKEYDWRCKSPHIRPLGWKRKWILEQFQALEAEVKGLKEALQSVMETLEAGDIMGHESYYVNRIKELLTPAEAGKK